MRSKTPDDLLEMLNRLGIRAETHEHEAVFTVAQSRSVREVIPGAHSKNLFLKDRKGRLFLVVARDDASIDLKRLHEASARRAGCPSARASCSGKRSGSSRARSRRSRPSTTGTAG